MPDSTTPTAKNKVITFPLPERIEYDVAEVEDFLAAVFHGKKHEENILSWAVNPEGHPAYPISETALFDKLTKSKRPRAFYFGTATCAGDEEGRLRNRGALFQGLYCVVLDDVGTKIPLEKFKDIKPSWIIESSEGNYQMGFILDAPIRDLGNATAFIRAIYSSGYTDEGGAMPTKLVRLPCGVNGKKGDKAGFNVQLKDFNPDRVWGYDELLSALNVPYKYETIIADENIFRRSRHLGASAWSPIQAKIDSATGVADPVLEWLNDNDMVKSVTDEWVTIECPWHEEHTSGDGTAGYKPLGRGATPHQRAFHCFHEHCKDNRTMQFLDWIFNASGIEAAAHDMSAELVRNWVFDASNGGLVWDLSSPNNLDCVKLGAFKELYADKVFIPTGKKPKPVAQHYLWTHSSNRVKVRGCKPFIGKTDLLVEDKGHLYLNAYKAPEWGEGAFDQADVDNFLDFIDYLIPDQKDADYFIDWLIAKVQDPCFRGVGIVMVAELQGVGRSTLGDMVATLLGDRNVVNMNFDKLLGDNNFNEWATKPLVISDETLTTQSKSPRYNTAYEALKDYVDPRPKRVEVNPKFGTKFEHEMVTSFLMFSNHRGALSVPSEDRRLYVMRNALIPESPEFFTRLNEWLSEKDHDGLPRWARSVYRWMMGEAVDLEPLLSPPELTDAKREMIAESGSGLDILADAIESVVGWDEGVFVAKFWLDIAEAFYMRVTALDTMTAREVLKKVLDARSVNFKDRRQVRLKDARIRPKVFKQALNRDNIWSSQLRVDEMSPAVLAKLRALLNAQTEDRAKAEQAVSEYLAERDL